MCWEALLLSQSGLWIVKYTVRMLRLSAFVSTINKEMIYLHVQSLPGVLCHEAEQGEERPPEAVKAGVTIVRVPSSFHTHVTFGTLSEMTKNKQTNKRKTWVCLLRSLGINMSAAALKYIFKNGLERDLCLDHVAGCTSEDGLERIVGIWNYRQQKNLPKCLNCSCFTDSFHTCACKI